MLVGCDKRTCVLLTLVTTGFAMMKLTGPTADGAGGFRLEFGGNGVVNDANPLPCDQNSTAHLKL